MGQFRLCRTFHTLLGNHRFHNGLVGGDLVHDLGQQTLHDRPEATGADVPLNGLVGDGVQGILREFQIHVIIFQQLLVLLHQRVLGLLQNSHQVLPLQGVQRCDHRQTAHQLRDDAEFQNIVGLHLSQKLADVLFLLALDIGAKADGLLVQPLFDDLFQAVKGTTADEQNVLGVHLDELLMGVLPAALGRHVGHGALHDFQQRLLHTFAGNIPGDGGIFALAGNFVDLIHIDDAPLGPLHVEIRRL